MKIQSNKSFTPKMHRNKQKQETKQATTMTIDKRETTAKI